MDLAVDEGLGPELVEPGGTWEYTEGDFSDEELTALALAASPDEPLASDAVPLSLYPGQSLDLLPKWYMPPVMAGAATKRWRVPVVMIIILAFLLVDAVGLCITYGQLIAA